MPKIVHLIGQLSRGGAEKQLTYLTDALKKRGWRQSVISFSAGGAWKERLEEIGIPVHQIPVHCFKPWRLYLLRRLVRWERPAIIQSWSDHTAVYAAWLPAIRKPRLIVGLRNSPAVDSHTGAAQKGFVLLRKSLERADYILSNSQSALTTLTQWGMAPPHTKVIRNIIAAEGRAMPGVEVETPRVLAAGSLKPLKAYDVLLRALGRLAEDGDKFELLLAGNGVERPRLQALAEELGIADRVRFLGELEDVPGLLATGHLLVHPAKSEGLCNTILEAMAEGLPVVACSVGGNPEIVADGLTGFLTVPGCPESLAAAIRRLLVDPSLRERMGQAGLQYVRRNCSEAAIADQHEQVYRELLTQGNT